MSYQYATENMNYEDLSSGRVLYNQHGTTAFPVRLSSEIFLRCTQVLKNAGNSGPYTIYDPLCGGAYALTSLGFLYGNQISTIYATDIDEMVIELAKKNLSLLTLSGLEERTRQIALMLQTYGKDSHKEALQSAYKLKEQLNERSQELNTTCFASDALRIGKNTSITNVDIVMADLPYGEVVDWVNADKKEAAIHQLLEHLLSKLSHTSVIAITAMKKSKICHEKLKKIGRFQVGKRQTVLLVPFV